jgi:glyoxalase family protein
MKLNGIHHITAITGDAQRNVDFYVGVMGLRLVKKSVNQDDPTVYHLFYGDEHAKPGLDLTFFEYPGAAPGRAGDGMIHRVVWRVGSPPALDFWSDRLAGAGVETTREGDSLRFVDPEGLEHELLVVADVTDEPLIAEHPEVPAEHALQGFHAVRASTPRTLSAAASCSRRASASRPRTRAGRREGTSAAGSTSTTPRLPSTASRAPAPCTTWRGTRRTRTMRRGGIAWLRAAHTRLR